MKTKQTIMIRKTDKVKNFIKAFKLALEIATVNFCEIRHSDGVYTMLLQFSGLRKNVDDTIEQLRNSLSSEEYAICNQF